MPTKKPTYKDIASAYQAAEAVADALAPVLKLGSSNSQSGLFAAWEGEPEAVAKSALPSLWQALTKLAIAYPPILETVGAGYRPVGIDPCTIPHNRLRAPTAPGHAGI